MVSSVSCQRRALSEWASGRPSGPRSSHPLVACDLVGGRLGQGADRDQVEVHVVGSVEGVGDHVGAVIGGQGLVDAVDRKSTRLNSSHVAISYAVFCLKKKTFTRRDTNVKT